MALREVGSSRGAEVSFEHEDQYHTAVECRAEGKALRDTVRREEHGGWKAHKDRRDPVELVLESNAGRMPDLVPIRHGRMLESPFALR